MLSWVSLAVVWSVSHGRVQSDAVRPSWWERAVPFVTFVVALGFIANILRKPYGIGVDDLDILHLSLWFSLAIGAWFVMRHRSKKDFRPNTRWIIALLIGSALIGLVPLVFFYRMQADRLPEAVSRLPVIGWITKHVPADGMGCADPTSADFYAAHTGRRIVPAETTSYMQESNETTIRRFVAFAGAYDLASSGAGDALRQYIDLSQGIACGQFPLQVKFLRMLGWPESRIDDAIGCPRAMLETRWQTIMSFSHAGTVDETVFKKACPWIIVPDDQKKFWRIPSDYVETRVDGTVSIFSSVKM
jgi:hypothetical protein